MEFDLFILVNAAESAISSAIQEYGAKLDRPRLVRSVSELVLRYLSKYAQ
jgi:hypothetical protein